MIALRRSSSILECKYVLIAGFEEFQQLVEVAPYWNVNVEIEAFQYDGDFVEVAPYWNVNIEHFTITFSI